MASSTRIFGNCCRALSAAAKTSAATTTTTTTVTKSRGRPNGILKQQPVSPAETSATTTTTTATVTKSRGRPNGILKPQPVSPALGKFLGTSEASRTDAVKKVWEYIKTHTLQNPANKREIHCDEKLKMIFDGKDKVGFLEIARLLTQHFQKAT